MAATNTSFARSKRINPKKTRMRHFLPVILGSSGNSSAYQMCEFTIAASMV